MSKRTSAILAALLAAIFTLPTLSVHADTKRMTIANSDIRAYVNGELIPSVNVGGNVMVTLGDLCARGFDFKYADSDYVLSWAGGFIEDTQTVSAYAAEITYIDDTVQAGGVTIKTIQPVKDGGYGAYEQLVPFAALGRAIGAEYSFSAAERKAVMTLPKKTFGEQLKMRAERYADEYAPTVLFENDAFVLTQYRAKTYKPRHIIELYRKDGHMTTLNDTLPTNVTNLLNGVDYISGVTDVAERDGKLTFTYASEGYGHVKIDAKTGAVTGVKTEKLSRKTAQALYSDVKTYINGRLVPTLNIGGKIAVAFNELVGCGFSTDGYSQWEGVLYWDDGAFVWDTYEQPPVPAGKNGKVMATIKYYDGFVVCGGKPVNAFRYVKDAANKDGKDDENLDYYPIMFLSDAVKAMGGQYAYSAAERKVTVTMPQLMTFKERLAHNFSDGYEDLDNAYVFDDYAVRHLYYAKQGGRIDVLDIYYKDGTAKSLLTNAPTNAIDYVDGRNAGYVSGIDDISFSDDGKTMRIYYGYTVYIDLPSATIIKVENPAK